MCLTKGIATCPIICSNKKVSFINSFLDSENEFEEPYNLQNIKPRAYVGVALHGDGFIIDKETAFKLLNTNEKYKKVVKPYLIGDDFTSTIGQVPRRWIIDFSYYDEKAAREFVDPFLIIEQEVKPVRMLNARESRKKYWWQFGEKAMKMQEDIRTVNSYIITAKTTKYLNFKMLNDWNIVLDQTLTIIASDDYYLFGILQSILSEVWARKYCHHLGARLQYSSKDGYETFPIPMNICLNDKNAFIEHIKKFDNLRNTILNKYGLGLTNFYNDMHSPSNSKLSVNESLEYINSLTLFRNEIQSLDNLCLSLYGWTDIDLRHDFYEVDYLPENDRIRYTIHPDARREVLKRLLQLNHERHEEEVRNGLWDKKKSAGKKKETGEKKGVGFADGKQEELPIYVKGEVRQGDLFESV
jgi:hypothetical protein